MGGSEKCVSDKRLQIWRERVGISQVKLKSHDVLKLGAEKDGTERRKTTTVNSKTCSTSHGSKTIP